METKSYDYTEDEYQEAFEKVKKRLRWTSKVRKKVQD